MTAFLFIILTLCLLSIAIQDLKERQVYWFLFPLLAACSGMLFYEVSAPSVLFATVIANVLFITVLLLLLYVYSKFKGRLELKDAIGLGDILMFYALSFSFSTIAFIYVFVGSLVFSLLAHILSKNYLKTHTIPLAGYMSLFFAATFIIAYQMDVINYLYAY
jgi:hypothetical protein